MKYVAILVAVLLVSSFAFANEARTPTNFITGHKIDNTTGVPVPGTPVGGETIADATVIASLPFYDTDNTCTYLNDYDEICPFSGSLSPDAVYSFTPTVDMFIDVDLCDSYFDTKVYIYENAVGFLVACNDDYCNGPNYPSSYLSFLEAVPVYAGQTYYIVVDGYGSGCGQFVLKVDEFVPPQPCEVVCPPDAIMENEPLCGPGYDDVFNGGCNSTPPVFSYLSCGTDPLFFCGEAGNWYDPYMGYYMRDTDWWSFTLTETKTVKLTTCAEFYVQTLLIIPQPDCSYYTYPYIVTADAYFPAVIEATLTAGEYWYWVGCGDFYDGTACGSQYVSSIEGWCDGTSTENASWGAVKEMFR
jgi:hypothetical protein